MSEVILTAESFDREVLASDVPVLVDFFATWCGPCRMLAPTIAAIAEEQQGKVKVCKLDIDTAPAIADRYQVSSIPYVVCFKNGEPVASALGFRPKEEIEKLFE